jgi:hypothetical protein
MDEGTCARPSAWNLYHAACRGFRRFNTVKGKARNSVSRLGLALACTQFSLGFDRPARRGGRGSGTVVIAAICEGPSSGEGGLFPSGP